MFSVEKSSQLTPLEEFKELLKIHEPMSSFSSVIDEKSKTITPTSDKSRLLASWSTRNPELVPEAIKSISFKGAGWDTATAFWALLREDLIPPSRMHDIFRFFANANNPTKDVEMAFFMSAKLFEKANAHKDPLGSDLRTVTNLAEKSHIILTKKKSDVSEKIVLAFWCNALLCVDPSQMLEIVKKSMPMTSVPDFLKMLLADKKISNDRRQVFLQELSNSLAVNYARSLLQSKDISALANDYLNIFNLLPPPKNIHEKAKIAWVYGTTALLNVNLYLDAINNLPWSPEIKQCLAPPHKIFTKCLATLSSQDVFEITNTVNNLLTWPVDRIDQSEKLIEHLAKQLQKHALKMSFPPINKKQLTEFKNQWTAWTSNHLLSSYLKTDMLETFSWGDGNFATLAPEKIKQPTVHAINAIIQSQDFQDLTLLLPEKIRATRDWVFAVATGQPPAHEPILAMDAQSATTPAAKTWKIMVDKHNILLATMPALDTKPLNSAPRKL